MAKAKVIIVADVDSYFAENEQDVKDSIVDYFAIANESVNENQGKKYNPRPVYNRKLLRSVIRAGVQKQFGQHHVSRNMAANFERIRKEQVR